MFLGCCCCCCHITGRLVIYLSIVSPLSLFFSLILCMLESFRYLVIIQWIINIHTPLTPTSIFSYVFEWNQFEERWEEKKERVSKKKIVVVEIFKRERRERENLIRLNEFSKSYIPSRKRTIQPTSEEKEKNTVKTREREKESEKESVFVWN